MKTIFQTLSFLPLTILAVGAAIAPVQAQSMQNGQTTSPAANSSDRIGIDASDPYSGQVYSGSQNPGVADGPQNNPMVNQPNNGSNSMQNRQAVCANSTSSMQTEPSSTDRIGVTASDPYSEQVYSGSQNPEMANGQSTMQSEQAACENTDMNNVRMPNSQYSVNSGTSADSRAQGPISRLQQMRYEVLDRPSS